LSVLVLPFLAGCMWHRHVVGLGGSDTNVVTTRQYYVLFGLFAVNEVDTQRLAGDLTSYSVETGYGLTDILISPFLLPLTLTSRTVRVRT
jgi:hypothetical protein